MPAYFIYLATLIAIYVIVALAYAIPVGYTGLLNLGHIGLLALGAYTGAILTTNGILFWLALPAAMVVTGLVGWLLAWPSRRIKGDYYALVTLGFTFVVTAVLLNWMSLTQGPFGITGIARPAGFVAPARYLLLVLVITVAVAGFVHRLMSSPFGRALESVRDDEEAAESLGKPVEKLKVISLTVSAALVGLAGALLAHFIQFINPQIFGLDNVLWVLAALVVGGLASVRGAIWGMVLLYALFEPLRFLHISPDVVGSLRLIIFSTLLLATVLVRPRGLFGRAQLGQ